MPILSPDNVTEEGAAPTPGVVVAASLPPALSSVSAGRNLEQRRERTREQILEAARAALVRVGYENITTRRIAEEAGVNVATLHYYFGTKEVLLSETIRHALKLAEVRLRNSIADAPDAPTALERLFETVWTLVQEKAGRLRYDLAVRGLRDVSARRDANALYDAFRALAHEVVTAHLHGGGTLAPGVSAESLSHYLVACVDGVILQHALNSNVEMTTRSLQLIKHSALEMMQVAVTPLSATRPDDKPAD